MDLRQFLAHCEYVKDVNPEWRTGQTYFNELHRLNPTLADYIRGTELDPFYRDEAITPFLDMLHGYYKSFGSVTDERRSNLRL